MEPEELAQLELKKLKENGKLVFPILCIVKN